jgi:hypothetical protein
VSTRRSRGARSLALRSRRKTRSCSPASAENGVRANYSKSAFGLLI